MTIYDKGQVAFVGGDSEATHCAYLIWLDANINQVANDREPNEEFYFPFDSV